MESLNKLLDKYREVCSLPSDKQLAESLGVTRQSVHRWRNGGGIDDDFVARMAEKIGEPSEDWMLKVHLENAPSAARRGWVRLTARLASAAAAIAGIYLISLTDPHSMASAAALSPLYIMRNYRYENQRSVPCPDLDPVSRLPALRRHLQRCCCLVVAHYVFDGG